MRASRLVPARSFPPYSYVPRRFPHPTRDAGGHSFGREEACPDALTVENWRGSEDYLFGFDLFNHGYYWEAHEAWEGLWHACGRKGEVAEHLKALIKLAAAGVKAREGNEAGVRRAAERASVLFHRLMDAAETNDNLFLGVSLAQLIQGAASLEAAPDRALNTAADPVIVALPFKIEIQTILRTDQ